MVYTPEVFTDNSPILPSQSVTVKKPSAIKSLCPFLDKLEVKPKTDVHRFFAAKSNHKAFISGSMLCYSIPKRWVHSKINQQVKEALYNWILQYPQVLQSPIANNCLKLSIDGQLGPQLVPKLLLHLLVRELHNSIFSPLE